MNSCTSLRCVVDAENGVTGMSIPKESERVRKKNFLILSSLSLHKQVKVLFPKANSNNANKTPRFGLFNLPRRIIVHIDMWHDMTFGQNGCFRKFQKIFLLFEIGQILKRTRSKSCYRPLSHSKICATRRS